MLVKDLIKLLKDMPQDKEIKVEIREYNPTIDYWEDKTYTNLIPYVDWDWCVKIDFND